MARSLQIIWRVNLFENRGCLQQDSTNNNYSAEHRADLGSISNNYKFKKLYKPP